MKKMKKRTPAHSGCLSRNAAAIPWMFPDIDPAGVLISACASTQITPTSGRAFNTPAGCTIEKQNVKMRNISDKLKRLQNADQIGKNAFYEL